MSEPIEEQNLVVPPGWEIYAISYSDSPYEEWAKIREATPVLDTGEGVYFISRWDLVNEVVRDPRHNAGTGLLSAAGDQPKLAVEIMKSWILAIDGPAHVRARGLVAREFTPRRIRELASFMRDFTEEFVSEIEATPEGETVDLIDMLAFRLPSQMIRTLLGIDRDRWAEVIEPVFRLGMEDPDAATSGDFMQNIVSILEDVIERGAPEGGILDKLMTPDPELGALSHFEVIANAVLIVGAAIDTTAGLIGNSTRCVLERPELLERLRGNPELVPVAIEETLRYEGPALSCSRSATVDFEVGGVQIPAGSDLLLGLAPANRDPRKYTRPDEFDLERDHSGLLSFGGGRHFCLGASLARAEARIVMERLLIQGRLDLELTEEPAWSRINPTVRNLARLPVRVRPRKS
jgi:cytochrome P450